MVWHGCTPAQRVGNSSDLRRRNPGQPNISEAQALWHCETWNRIGITHWRTKNSSAPVGSNIVPQCDSLWPTAAAHSLLLAA
eukprot:9321653-Alexandrium_andersonii.AAC.1